MSKKYMNFVLTGDKNYICPLSVVMTSILKNVKKTYIPRFFLFTSDVSETDFYKICKVKKIRKCEIVNISMEKYLHYFSSCDVSTFKLQYISLATYYRLLMFKILPDDVDKCFYVDGDMIIDRDLSQAYESLTNDKLAAVVMEVLAMSDYKNTLHHLSTINDFTKFVKEPFEYPYFNAGFFAVNINKARRLKIFEQCLDFLKRYPNPPFADQDVLNAILGQKYHENLIWLNPKYNVFCDVGYSEQFSSSRYSADEIKQAFDNPAIYHYAGANKPWINRNVLNFYKTWWKYCKISPFAKIKQPPKNILITNRKFYLLGIKICYQKICYKYNKLFLFGIIPLYFIHNKNNISKHKLFGFIPILSIKRK